MKVGWIGLGRMGSVMARRVHAAGHQVTALVRRPEAEEQAQAAGLAVTKDLAAAVSQAEVVMVSLFDDGQLRNVLRQGALDLMGPGAVLVVHTTGSPQLVEGIASAAAEGVRVLDAPFSGDEAAAGRGQVVLMAAGEAATLALTRPVLEAYCDPILHVGPVGAGRRLKLLNNLLFAANLQLAAEALRAAASCGLDHAATVQAITRSSGGSYALAKFAGDKTLDEVLGGVARYVEKDVALACATAAEEGLEVALLAQAARGELAQ